MKKKSAVLITTDGEAKQIELDYDEDTGISLKAMYEAIGNGCDIVEVIPLDDGRLMWLDEEGKLREPMPPPNIVATRLLAEAGGLPGDIVMGNVIITKEGDVK